MPLTAPPSGGGDFKLVPEGTHRAICNRVVDLGRQITTYMGAETIKHQIYIRWELPDEQVEWEKDGEKMKGPAVIGNTYTFSLADKANLKRDLESWRGKRFTDDEKANFDMFKLIGAPCQVTITHRESGGKTYANVTGVAGWPKGMDRPTGTECVPLKYSQEEPDDFSDLPEWLQNKIKAQVLDDDSRHEEAHEDPDYGDPRDREEIPF